MAALRKVFVDNMEDVLIPAIRKLGPEHRTQDVLATLIASAVAPYPEKEHADLAEMFANRIEDIGILIDETPEWALNNNFLASRIPTLLSIPGTSVAKYLSGFAIPEKNPHLIWKRFPIDMFQIGPNRFALCWNERKMQERKYSDVAARNTDMNLLTHEIHEFRLLYTIAHMPSIFLLESPRVGHNEIAVLNVIHPSILAEVREAAVAVGGAGGHAGGSRRRRRAARATRRRATRRRA